MQINFDTSSIGQAEAQGLIALLSNLFPPSGQPSLPPQSASSLPPPTPVALVPMENNLTQAPEPTDPTSQAPEPTATGRRRRTKAEMAADALLEKAGHATTTAATTTAATTEPEPSELPPATQAQAQAVSADELRALLNGYIAKHSMEAAIAVLKSFNCNRVTEALSLPADQLSQLAEALRG